MMAGLLLVRSRRMLLAQPPLAFVIACCRNFLNSAVKDRLFAAGRRKKLNKINNLRLREKSADELPVFSQPLSSGERLKVFTKLARAVALCALLGSVQAATVDCPGAFSATLTRQVTVTGALSGGSCHYQVGNFNTQPSPGDVFGFLGAYTEIE